MSSVIQRTFAAGEIAPALTARADLIKYVTGLRTCRNFMVQRSGGVATRPGTKLVAECKTNSISVQLHRYIAAETGESILIESGGTYLRFFKNGGPVTLSGVAAYNGANSYVIGDIVSDGGTNYWCRADAAPGDAPPDTAFWYAMPGSLLEIPHPFTTAGWNSAQSGNVITMTSTYGGIPPHELIYGGDEATWVLRIVDTKPGVDAPAGLVATPGAAGSLTYAYQVTAAADGSYEESLSAGIASCPSTAAPTTTAPITLSWTPVPGVAEYYIYCDPYGNGTFGFVGTATCDDASLGTPATFNDAGFIPDFGVTPPLPNTPFATTGDYPRRSGNHQQRRLFANTNNAPDAVWGSRVGFISNFNISSPLQDDDSITFKIAGNQHNPVRHLLGLKTLIVLTDAGAWQVGAPLQALTPSTLFADQYSYEGADPNVEPVVVGNAIIYLQARGSIIRDLSFDQAVEGLAGRDLTLFASHLFDGYTIQSMDYQQTPHSVVWCCRNDGTLLSLTYLREQDIWGWARHDTQLSGRFEHVAVVPENGEDVVYVITRRTIGGVFHRFIERLESRTILSYNADAYFVDCGLSYSGAAATTFSGLNHLAGQMVAILADGVVVSNGWDAATSAVVSATGTITLSTPAQNVHIGLYIRPQLETLDLDAQSPNVVRDKKKNIKSVTLLLEKSTKTFYAGPDANHLMPFKRNPFESAALDYSGPVEVGVTTEFNDVGRLFIELRDPVPFTVLGIIPSVEIGG